MRSPSFACSIVFLYASYSRARPPRLRHRDLVEHRELHARTLENRSPRGQCEKARFGGHDCSGSAAIEPDFVGFFAGQCRRRLLYSNICSTRSTSRKPRSTRSPRSRATSTWNGSLKLCERVEFLRVSAVGAYDRSGAWELDGFQSAAAGLRSKCRIESARARSTVRLARRLEELPEVSAAFAAGESRVSMRG